jgi:hypothetical protein
MTLKEAICLKLKYQFEKETMTTTNTGDGSVFHYFRKTINDVTIHISPAEDKEGVWYGSIFDFNIKFYAVGSFEELIKSITKGEWDAN